jgi:hypothetical protein
MRIFIEGTMLIYEAKMQCNILNKYLCCRYSLLDKISACHILSDQNSLYLFVIESSMDLNPYVLH